MRIRKKEPSVGILGKIVNLFSNSTKDTYSCDYINNNAGLRKVSNMSYIDLTEPGIYLVDSPTMTDVSASIVTSIPFETILYISSYESGEYNWVTQLLIGSESFYRRVLSINLETGETSISSSWSEQQYNVVVPIRGDGDNITYSCSYLNGDILYENSAGSANPITLARTVDDYEYVEIFAVGNASLVSCKVPIALYKSASFYTTGASQMYQCTVKLSGTSLTFTYNRQIKIADGTVTDSSVFKIIKVVGYGKAW